MLAAECMQMVVGELESVLKSYKDLRERRVEEWGSALDHCAANAFPAIYRQ